MEWAILTALVLLAGAVCWMRIALDAGRMTASRARRLRVVVLLVGQALATLLWSIHRQEVFLLVMLPAVLLCSPLTNRFLAPGPSLARRVIGLGVISLCLGLALLLRLGLAGRP